MDGKTDGRTDGLTENQTHISHLAKAGTTTKTKDIFTVCINQLYSGGLFHCYMLDETFCHFRGVGVYFVTFIIFLMESPVSKHCWS